MTTKVRREEGAKERENGQQASIIRKSRMSREKRRSVSEEKGEWESREGVRGRIVD